MMRRNNTSHSFSDAKFNNLCAHYKDTYDIHLASVKQRDMLFYALLVVLALFSLQFTSSELVNNALCGLAKKQLDLTINKSPNLLSTLLWFLLFGLSSKYYQTVIQIERQYDYIHYLEEFINTKYYGTRAFTREGKSYLDKYPLFSNWTCLLYTLAFPTIILLCIVIRIYYELKSYETLGASLVPIFTSYLLIGTSTILYLGKLHGPSILKLFRRRGHP